MDEFIYRLIILIVLIAVCVHVVFGDLIKAKAKYYNAMADRVPNDDNKKIGSSSEVKNHAG
jgi:hypothetical protein